MFKALRRSTSGGNSSTSSPAKNASSAAAAAAAGSAAAAAAAAAAASAAALASPASANTEALCGRLAVEIRGQETLHASLLKVQQNVFLGFNLYLLTTSFQDLARLAASPSVSEEDFHATFLKALSRSGLETR